MYTNILPVAMLQNPVDPLCSLLAHPLSRLSGILRLSRDLSNMVNLRSLASLTCLSQIAVQGGDAYTNSSELKDIVPKRDVLYVGGHYANITASLTI